MINKTPKTKLKKILIAEDNRQEAELVHQLLLDHEYAPLVVHNGVDALSVAFKEQPDLILLDVDMPGENGFNVAKQLKAHRTMRLIPIIMLTGLSALNFRLQGIEMGVDDYLTKPYRPVELLARIRALLRVKALNDQLDDTESIVFTLARMIEAKDSFTSGHADRVSRFAVALGKSLNLPQEQLDTLDKGGLLHDIGKMAVPDAILLKPGTLTQEEFAIMKPHSMIGCSICERLRSAKDALPLIRNHHEKLDGSGYPDGLKGDEISLLVRLITVVDIYDALTSQRSYKSAWTNEETFRIMYEEVKRGWWDGDLVRAWEKFIQSGAMGPLLYQKHLEPGITIIKRAIL